MSKAACSRPTHFINADLSQPTNSPVSSIGFPPRDGLAEPNNKLLNVTITILSMSGVQVKESENGSKKNITSTVRGRSPMRSKLPLRKKSKDDGTEDSSLTMSDALASETNVMRCPPTTIVASFSRKVTSSQKNIMTHVPSLPIDLPPSNSSKTVNDVIHWPMQDGGSVVGGTQGLSSFQFQRSFLRENQGNIPTTLGKNVNRFIPQSSTINLAISRNGRMFKLGSANILISGEENGETSINVPVLDCNQQHSKTAASQRRFRRVTKHKEIATPMVRLKGETLKCGINVNATLRILVHVSEAPEEKHQQADTGLSRLQPMLISCASDPSWEYDPKQSAVVLKRRDSTRNEKGLHTIQGPLIPDLKGLGTKHVPNIDEDVQSSSTETMTFDHSSATDSCDEQSSCSSSSSGSSCTITSDQTEHESINHIPAIEIFPLMTEQSNKGTSSNKSALCMLDDLSNEQLQCQSRGREIIHSATRKVEDATVETSSTMNAKSLTKVQKKIGTVFPHISGGAKSWGRRFICGIPSCGEYNQEGVLSSVKDEDTLLVEPKFLKCRDRVSMASYDSDDSSTSSKSESGFWAL